MRGQALGPSDCGSPLITCNPGLMDLLAPTVQHSVPLALEPRIKGGIALPLEWWGVQTTISDSSQGATGIDGP